MVKQLRSTPNLQGVVTASSGNHGQAVACRGKPAWDPCHNNYAGDGTQGKGTGGIRWGANVEFAAPLHSKGLPVQVK